MPTAHSGSQALRVAALPAFWLLTAVMMARDWWNDPYDPRLEGTDAYGHNSEDALANGLVLTFFELAILVAILRPWSYDRSWGRASIALALLLPWTLLWMLGAMHAGGVFGLHWMWLALLVVGLTVTVLVSLVSTYRGLTPR